MSKETRDRDTEDIRVQHRREELDQIEADLDFDEIESRMYRADRERGRKDDKDKTRWDLLNQDVLRGVANVLTFGAKKYDDNNWMHVEHAESRYYAAMMRHLDRHRLGAERDPESGRPHWAHFMCNAMFLAWFMQKDLAMGTIDTKPPCNDCVAGFWWRDGKKLLPEGLPDPGAIAVSPTIYHESETPPPGSYIHEYAFCPECGERID